MVKSSKFETPEQVGGDHYVSKYGHWDWVGDMAVMAGLGYFEGNATKYVVRWQKKNGKNDLAKALSYVVMMGKISAEGGYKRNPVVAKVDKAQIEKLTKKMAKMNNLRKSDMAICFGLATWKTQKDIEDIMDKIKALIEDAV